MIRLFIAFPIETTVRDYLAKISKRFKPLTPGVKWVDPKNMHLTARFLGDTDPKMVTPLIEVIQSTCENFGPVKTTVNRIGGFPNLKRPRVIWAGLSDSADTLTQIVKQLQQGLDQLGLEPDNKPFKPHLTFGRVKQTKGIDRLVEELGQFEFNPREILFDRLELIQSTLTPQGPIYKTLGLGKLAERFE